MRRWLAADYGTVGALYLGFGVLMLVAAVAAVLVVLAERFEPGLAFLQPDGFDRAVTAHGLLAVFGILYPAFAGLANRMVPPMIGVEAMALPRTNALSFWALPLAFVLLGGALSAGSGPGADSSIGRWPAVPAGAVGPFAAGLLLVGISSILWSWSVLATVVRRRSAETPFARMPVFVRTTALTAGVWFVLALTLVLWALSLVDASLRGGAPTGGWPVTFRYDLWFYTAPEIYLVVLPAIGIVTEVFAAAAGRRPPGADAIVQATAFLAVLALLGWIGRMSLGKGVGGELFFEYASLLAAVPAAVISGAWAAALWRRRPLLDVPVCFALAAALFLALALLSGVALPLASVSAGSAMDAAHGHYLFVAVGLFGAFAGTYRWLPWWTGRMYDETLAKVHFWLSVVGLNATFLPQYLAGASGMLRRIPDYPLTLADLNAAASAGGFLLGFAQLVFVFVVLKAWRGGPALTGAAGEALKGPEWESPAGAPAAREAAGRD